MCNDYNNNNSDNNIKLMSRLNYTYWHVIANYCYTIIYKSAIIEKKFKNLNNIIQ